MQKKIEGIIVSTVDYKESSKIVNILTNENKIIGVIAKGSKNIKSKLRNSTEVLCYGEFYLSDKNRGLPSVVEVDIINYFKNVRRDFLKMSYSLYLLELVFQVCKHDSSDNVYNILISSLIKIENDYDPRIITNIVEVKLLNNLGIKPNMESCCCCGGKNNIITISSYKGGYLCSSCCSNEYKYDLKTLKLLKMFYYVDLDNISKIDISDVKIRNEINLFLDDYYERYSGLYLKSKEVIEKLSKI